MRGDRLGWLDLLPDPREVAEEVTDFQRSAALPVFVARCALACVCNPPSFNSDVSATAGLFRPKDTVSTTVHRASSLKEGISLLDLTQQVRPGIGSELGGFVDEMEQVQVGDAVARLHGGDDAQFGESGDISRLNELGVLDPVTQGTFEALLGLLRGLTEAFEDVQYVVIGLIADGVDGNRNSGLGG